MNSLLKQACQRSELVYTDALGDHEVDAYVAKEPVRLPKTHHNNPNDVKMMA